MCVHAASWAELRSCVKNCAFHDCKRNKQKNREERLHVFFERKEDSLSQIRFVAVSQDPGVALKSKYHLTSSECIERCLGKDAQKEPKLSETLRARNPRDRIKEIFRREFDPSTGDIYWTHALKCLPRETDSEINGIWKKSAPLCAKFFKNELDLIPSKKLTIIALGRYALAMCRHALCDEPLANTQGVMECVRTWDIDRKFPYGDKEVSLFPFLHPANRERVLGKLARASTERSREIRMREEKFVGKIQEIQKQNQLLE